MALAIW